MRLTRFGSFDLPIPWVTYASFEVEGLLQERARKDDKVLGTHTVHLDAGGMGLSLEVPLGKILRFLKFGKHADDIADAKEQVDRVEKSRKAAEGPQPIETPWEELKIAVPRSGNLTFEQRQQNARAAFELKRTLTIDKLLGAGSFSTEALEALGATGERGTAAFASVHPQPQVYAYASFDLSSVGLASIGLSGKSARGTWKAGPLGADTAKAQNQKMTGDGYQCWIDGDMVYGITDDGRTFHGKVPRQDK
jgi:hypothetical protein